MTDEEKKAADEVEITDIDAGTDVTDENELDIDNETDIEVLKEALKSKVSIEDKLRKQLATTVHQKEHFKTKANEKTNERPVAKSDESTLVSFMVRNKDLDTGDAETAINISKALSVPLDQVRDNDVFKAYLASKEKQRIEKDGQLGASRGGYVQNTPLPTKSPDKHRQFAESRVKEIQSRSKK